MATVAIVGLTPAKNLNTVFGGFLVVSPLFNNFLDMFKYIRGWYDPKKLISKPLRGSKLPLIRRFIEFLRSKSILFQEDIKKILIAFQQSLSSGQKTADFPRYWQILVKIIALFIPGAFLYFFALIFFTWTQATIFVSASFLPKVSKVKERDWKLNFVFGYGQNWQGSAQLSLLSPLSPP